MVDIMSLYSAPATDVRVDPQLTILVVEVVKDSGAELGV